MMMNRRILFLGVAAAILSVSAHAQESAQEAQEAQPPVAIDIAKIDIAPVEPFPEGFRSLFFTREEDAHITAALSRMPVTARAAVETAPPPDLSVAQAAAAPRVLHLSGIVFINEEEWSVWLNGRQVTPASRPSEIREIAVARDGVSLKWFDPQTQTVIPVRLRPQQRFNIDTKSFMPGVLNTPAMPVDPAASPLMP